MELTIDMGPEGGCVPSSVHIPVCSLELEEIDENTIPTKRLH